MALDWEFPTLSAMLDSRRISLFVYMQMQSGFSVFGQGITLLIIMKCNRIMKYKELYAIRREIRVKIGDGVRNYFVA